ncbi:MAG: hypothetical protein IV100_03965 [Myxococcales bacterium]|nr:hypothetical protein [Myxococcales bacterium]
MSDNIAQLTSATRLSVRRDPPRSLFVCFDTPCRLQLQFNSFTAMPAGVSALTQLTKLDVSRRRGDSADLTRLRS